MRIVYKGNYIRMTCSEFGLVDVDLQPHLARHKRRVNHDLCDNFLVFWAAVDIPSPWSENYSVNVDTLVTQ